MVEQETLNLLVRSSSLRRPTKFMNDFIQEFQQISLGQLLINIDPLLLLIEAAIVMVSIVFAFWTQKRIVLYLEIATEKRTHLKTITVQSIKKIIFPFSMLFIVLVGRAIFGQFSSAGTLLNIASPLLFSLMMVRLLVYLLRMALRPGPLVKAWENLISTVIWAVVVFHLLGWLPDVIKALDVVGVSVGEIRISLLSVVKLASVVGLLLIISAWISRLIERSLQGSRILTPAAKVGINKASKLALFVVAILIALNSVGIDLTALAVFGGALGVGLGFGLQRIASNFISGFILIFDRSIRPGDVISINEKFGWVQELRARYVVVRDRDGVETLIPNENLITTEVINWSYSDQKVRLKVPVQISYKSDPELAMQLLVKAAADCNRALAEPTPVARLMGFGENGLDLELRVWISDPTNGVGGVRSDINRVIWREFQQAGIKIPYPQREVKML